MIPDDTYVLVGFYKNQEQYDWIQKNKMYNFRTGTGKGTLILDNETVTAKYLLLHTKDDSNSSDLWEIVSRGPKVISKENLQRKGYHSPSGDYYLLIELKEVNLLEFGNSKWDFKKLKNYKSWRESALPFTTSLTELMKQIIK